LSFLAVCLVLVAAVLHASWNLLAKGNRDAITFVTVALFVSTVLWSPVFGLVLAQNPIPAEGWPWIATTGVLHAVYFWWLATAYKRADLALVYPIARGLGPALVTVVGTLGLGESITPLGLVGVVAIIVGIYLANLRKFSMQAFWAPLRNLVRPAGRYALLTGVLVGVYTLVDKQGVSRVHPIVYVYLMFALSTAGVAAYFLGRGEWRRWHDHRPRARQVLAVAVFWVAAYLLVLFALRLAPASYVAAAREVSIVFVLALSAIVLREQVTPPRLAGAACIVGGISAIAFA